MSDAQMDMTDSILNSTKKALGIMPDVTAFDPDLIMHINTAFSKLNPLDVGPSDTYRIEDSTAEWSDFYTNHDINMVRSYIYLEVRMLFDPPTASVLTSFEKTKAELEWRLNVADDELIHRTVQNGTEQDD